MVRTYSIIRFIVVALSLIFLTAIIIITFDAIFEPNAISVFDLDFSEKNKIISSYGSLISGLLSFLAILFILLDLSYQQKQNFLKDQKEQEEIQRLQDDRIKAIYLFLNENLTEIEQQKKYFDKFVENEKQSPLRLNSCNKISHTIEENYNLTNQHSTYKSFQSLRGIENRNELYVNLIKLLKFFLYKTDDLYSSYKDYRKSKKDNIIKAYTYTNNLIKYTSDLIINIHSENDFKNIQENEDYILLDRLQKEITPTTPGENYSLSHLRENILMPILKEFIRVYKPPYNHKGALYDPKPIIDLVKKITDQIKQLEINSISFTQRFENGLDQYYIEQDAKDHSLYSIKEQLNQVMSREFKNV